MVTVLKQNWRDVGVALESLLGYSPIPPGHLFRSGNLDFCTHQELGRPRTILNLRAGSDRTQDFWWAASADFVHLPAANNEERYYTDNAQVRKWLVEVANFVASENTKWPLLVHCRAGKDRTGVVIAMLLKVAGLDDAAIIEEYSLSLDGSPHLIERAMQGFGPDISAYFRGQVDLTALRARLGGSAADSRVVKRSASFYLGPGSSSRVEAIGEVVEDEPWHLQICSCVGSTAALQLNLAQQPASGRNTRKVAADNSTIGGAAESLQDEAMEEEDSIDGGKLTPAAANVGAGLFYVNGDATKASYGKGKKIVAHIVNDLGRWGKGFVLSITSQWGKLPQRSYFEWHKNRTKNDFRLGAVQIVEVSRLVEIANMVGQSGIQTGASRIPPVRYDAVEEALEQVALHARHNDQSIHLPRIGAGLAGGDWSRIEPMLLALVERHSVTVFVYTL